MRACTPMMTCSAMPTQTCSKTKRSPFRLLIFSPQHLMPTDASCRSQAKTCAAGHSGDGGHRHLKEAFQEPQRLHATLPKTDCISIIAKQEPADIM